MQYLQSKTKISKFGTKRGLAKTLKIYLKSKIPSCNLPLFLILHLHVLLLSQKQGDDQFSMILQQFTSYVLVCQETFNLQYPPNTRLLHIRPRG